MYINNFTHISNIVCINYSLIHQLPSRIVWSLVDVRAASLHSTERSVLEFSSKVLKIPKIVDTRAVLSSSGRVFAPVLQKFKTFLCTSIKSQVPLLSLLLFHATPSQSGSPEPVWVPSTPFTLAATPSSFANTVAKGNSVRHLRKYSFVKSLHSPKVPSNREL